MIAIVAMILAVLAIPILGIIAAIAIPNLLTAVERTKQRRTIVSMRAIASEVESHAAAKGSYPENLTALAIETRDGWGFPMRYECIPDPDRACAGYGIVSAGRDRQFDYESVREYSEERISAFDCDIVFANGSFLQYPEGVQR